MSVIIAGISSGILAYWASKERAKTEQAHNNVNKLRKIRDVTIDATSLLSLAKSSETLQNREKIVVFMRGVVLPLSFVENLNSTRIESLSPLPSSSSAVDIIRSPTTGNEAVVIEETTTHIYVERPDSILTGRSTKESRDVVSKKRRQVPFVIANRIAKPCFEYVYVNLESDGSEKQLPLEKVYSCRKILFNHLKKAPELRVDELTEEETISVGTNVTALGIFSLENGIPTIRPYKGFPLFLSNKHKDQLIEELCAEVEQSSNKGDLLSRISMGLAGFAIGAFVTHLTWNLSKA